MVMVVLRIVMMVLPMLVLLRHPEPYPLFKNGHESFKKILRKVISMSIRSPVGTELSCANWQIEAAMRMLMNNLDPRNAEDPDNLIVYGGTGKAARNWKCYHAIINALKELEPDETLLVQSGKPVGVARTHTDAPRVLIANSNLVGNWANWDYFNELEKKGLIQRA